MRPLRVIVIDDEPNTCSFLQAVFTAEGHDCRFFLRADEAEANLASDSADLALVDVYLGSTNGVDLVGRLRAIQPTLYTVVMTAHVSVETAARAVSEGAIDYVSKPLTIDNIRDIIARVHDYQDRERAERRPRQPEPEDPAESVIIGRSPRMLEVYKAIGRVAPSNANVLITGPSGTGKELVARAIHDLSRRKEQPFTPVNCGSFTETILESELFGHEKGAFTGADRIHQGLIEASHGGTLFLDEVTETTLSFQVKLLRVIQEQQVRRVGSTKYIPVDVRILAASNRDVPALMRAGQFREDLYYRLSVVQIVIPPLHDRRDDIPLLVTHFLREFNRKNDTNLTIEPAAVQRLQSLPWPGNVRELENAVNRLAIFAASGQITLSDVEAEQHRSSDISGVPHPSPSGAGAPPPDRLLDLEREHILRVLKETQGNKSEAARRLGIERKTLYKKAVRFGIDLQAKERP